MCRVRCCFACVFAVHAQHGASRCPALFQLRHTPDGDRAVALLGLSPPPPTQPIDVLNLLVLLIAMLSSTLLILLLRKRRRHATVKSATTAATTATTSTTKTKPLPANDYPRGPLLILWGSQTGTAEGFGNELMREARQRGWNAKSVDLEEVSGEDLESEAAPVVLLMATHGEGEPTDNAVEFYNWANDKERDEERPFGGLRYAVFALGNTQFEHFCYMGRWAHRRLAELGATPVCDLGEGDDDDDILNDFELWMEGLWPALSGEVVRRMAMVLQSTEKESTAPGEL